MIAKAPCILRLLLFAADKDKVVFDVLGNLRLEIARQLDLLKKDDFKFLWVTEFPLLEYSEEEDRYVAMHHPFTTSAPFFQP